MLLLDLEPRPPPWPTAAAEEVAVEDRTLDLSLLPLRYPAPHAVAV